MEITKTGLMPCKLKFYCRKGFSLVEILVSMLIIGILVLSFTPLFVSSVKGITGAGDRSNNLYDAQGKMETVIGTRQGILFEDGSFVPLDKSTFPVDFEGDDLSNQTGGRVAVDSLTTFLAGTPSIKLVPDCLFEGYPPDIAGGLTTTITVEGSNTHFSTAWTNLKIRDKNDFLITEGYSLNVQNSESATITLRTGLTNAKSPYIIEMSTGSETVRCALPVYFPLMVAVGDDTILVSSAADGSHWETRPAWGLMLNGLTHYDREGDDGQFVVVGDSGAIYILTDGADWEEQTSGTFNTLYAVTRGKHEDENIFVAVGEQGTILTSSDGKEWSSQNSDVVSRLNGITWGGPKGNELFVAVGDAGAILTSRDGLNWGEHHFEDSSLYFCAAAWGSPAGSELIVAVGGKLSTSEDGWKWSDPMDLQLNGVTWSKENELFVAVGHAGTILTSPDGENWNPAISSGTNENIHDVAWSSGLGGGLLVAVGDNGTVLTSPDGDNWIAQEPVTYRSLRGLDVR
ncbi:MAG: prepilin-type N-terminal cleavage/methylation domain-containing protein [Firmicutes bacterium]|nr:prepilin-type N-terminal cleavage/methylation domain-containing protein [Bacillota bacterium]